MYYFPTAAVTNYYKPNRKQHQFVMWSSGYQKSETVSLNWSQGAHRPPFLLEALGILVSLSLPTSRVVSSTPKPAMADEVLSWHSLVKFPLLPFYKDPCGYPGPIQIVWANLKILNHSCKVPFAL